MEGTIKEGVLQEDAVPVVVSVTVTVPVREGVGERIEEFTRDGRNFMYINFSGFMKNQEYAELIEEVKPRIAKYPEHSLYTISHIEDVKYDSKTKKLFADYMINNEPYVKRGAVVGLDGIKKIILNSIFKMSGRSNMILAFTKEEAIESLLRS